VVFLVVGCIACAALLTAAVWMGLLARRNPARTFRVRQSRFGPMVNVTYDVWLRRYLPWGLGFSLILVVLGLIKIQR
jgi:hypothetical protein